MSWRVSDNAPRCPYSVAVSREIRTPCVLFGPQRHAIVSAPFHPAKRSVMGQSRAAGTLVYPVEAGYAGTSTFRETVPPVLPKRRLLDPVREAPRVRRPQPRGPDIQPATPAARKFMADGIGGRDSRRPSPSEEQPGFTAPLNGVRETSDVRTRPAVAICSDVPQPPSSSAPRYAGLPTSSLAFE
jgi:hypothetical protein